MRRSAAALTAAAAVAALGWLVVPLSAHADPRDGWCRAGEGQAVVVDPNPPDTGGSPEPVIIRCIPLPGGPGATAEYPIQNGPPLGAPLDSAGIPYKVSPGGLIVDVAGYDTPEGYYWHYVQGENGAWLGNDSWFPEAIVDTMVGIRLTDSPAAPVTVPKLLPAPAPSPSVKPPPTPGPSGDPTPGPSGDPTPDPSGDPTPDPSGDPTPPPTQQPTPTGRPPGRTPPPRPRTTPPPNPTGRPEPENRDDPDTDTPPEASDEPDATVSPSEEAGATAVVADASPSPSRVWGEESSVRSPVGQPGQQDAAPWTPWLVALAGLVLVGGLGSSFAGTLRETGVPALEDE